MDSFGLIFLITNIEDRLFAIADRGIQQTNLINQETRRQL